MSFSFEITAYSKNEAGSKVESKLAEIVAGQPAHAHDRQAVQDAAEGQINLLSEPTSTEEIHVSISGALSWQGTEQKVFLSSSVNISARVRAQANG